MPYRDAPNVKKPSEHLHDLLSGAVAPKDTPEAVLSWARLSIYQGACEVLAEPDKARRRAMLDKIPESIRPYVEREAKEIWRKRKHAEAIPAVRARRSVERDQEKPRTLFD